MKMRVGLLLLVLAWVLVLSGCGGGGGENKPELKIDKTSYARGETIKVDFTASGSWPRDAWIGIIPSNIPHGSEATNDQHDVLYQYIEKRTQGQMVFKAPGPGQWDVRMNDTDNNGKEVASVTFTVR